MKLSYSKYIAINIIRQCKEIMVKQGYLFYNNKRLLRCFYLIERYLDIEY